MSLTIMCHKYECKYNNNPEKERDETEIVVF